jgi:hypothetical protein
MTAVSYLYCLTQGANMPLEMPPYTANDGTTCVNEPQLGYRVVGYYTVPVTIADFKQSLYEDGPSYWRYDVYEDFYTFWGTYSPGAVYVNNSNNYVGGHAVLLIGWDEQKQAFLCKNSWGTGGPNGDGTFWISYGEHLNDLRFGMANFDVVSLTCNSNSDCDDGTDNDGDGLIDCSDPDCSDLLIKRHTSLSPSKKIGRNSSISRFRKYEFSVKKCI